MSRQSMQLAALAAARKKVDPDTPEAAKLDAIEAVVKAAPEGATAEALKVAAAVPVEQP